MLREYITLGGATIAIVDALGVGYVHDDHLGTPQVMTDGSAAVVWDASYRPFGEASIAGAAANDQRFPGQTADAETGYYDNWHRTYDPRLGRYLQSDPIGILAGFNTYAYANGNPVMYVDPNGNNPAAATTCLGLILVDGPLPIGDIACGGVVAATLLYTLYESGCPATISPIGSGDDGGFFPRNHNNPSEPPLPKDPKDPLPVPPPIWDFTPSPALEDSPYHPDNVNERVRPPYKMNEAHDPSSNNFNPRKTPEPPDAEQVYQSAVRGDMGTWWGRGADGKIYRYFSDNAGTVHFSGSFSPKTLPHNAPKEFRK